MVYIVEDISPKATFVAGIIVSGLEKLLLGGFPVLNSVALMSSSCPGGFFTRIEGYYDCNSKYRYRFETNIEAVTSYIVGASLLYIPEIYKLGEKTFELFR